MTSVEGGTGWVDFHWKTWKKVVVATCSATTIWPGEDHEMSTKTNNYVVSGSAGFGNYVVMGKAVSTTAVPVTEPVPLPTATLAPASVITLSPEPTGDVKGMRPAGVEIWTEGARTRTVYMQGRVQY